MPTFPDNYEYDYPDSGIVNYAESSLKYTHPAIRFDFINYNISDTEHNLISMYIIESMIENCFSKDKDNHINIIYEMNESPDDLYPDEEEYVTQLDIDQIGYINDQISNRDKNTVRENLDIFKFLTHYLNNDSSMMYRPQGIYKPLVEILYFYYSTVQFFEQYRNLPEYRMPYLNLLIVYFDTEPEMGLYHMMDLNFKRKSKNIFVQGTQKTVQIMGDLLADHKIEPTLVLYKNLVKSIENYSVAFGVETHDQEGLIEGFIKYAQG